MEACIIRKIYCGSKKRLPADTASQKYSRKGTAYECMQRGFGVADWAHKKAALPKNSLQQIPYIGPVYESAFKRKKIGTIPALIKRCESLSAAEKKVLLSSCVTRANDSIDQRALNSVIYFLHTHGVTQLPRCKIVKE